MKRYLTKKDYPWMFYRAPQDNPPSKPLTKEQQEWADMGSWYDFLETQQAVLKRS